MGSLLKLVVAAALVIGAYAIITPYRTVQNLTQALENENPEKVDDYVDFDAVRENARNDFAQSMGINEGNENSFAAALATGISAAFINNIVSPETMVTILKDKSRRDRMGLSDSFGDLVSRGDWHGTDQFVLFNNQGRATMLLQRDGLQWQVTAMRLK